MLRQVYERGIKLKRKVKSTSKKRYKFPLIIIATVLLFILCGAGLLFYGELKIISSIKNISDEKPIYYMEVDSDYYFEDFLEAGGATSDSGVSAFLTGKISKGFYSVNVQ